VASRSGRPRRGAAGTVGDPAAGRVWTGAVVSQHDPIAPQRANRGAEIELHKAFVAGIDRPQYESTAARADRIDRAEMHVHRQAVAQRRRC